MEGVHEHSPVVQCRPPGPNLGGGAYAASSRDKALRGEILSYDPTTGDGLISGDDLQRYAFTSTAAGLEPGRRVDFVVEGKYARDIITLSFTRPATAPKWVRAVAKSPLFRQNHFLSFNGRIGRVHFWAVRGQSRRPLRHDEPGRRRLRAGGPVPLAFLLWIGLVEGDKGDNRFGPNPKGE
jgi:hypothetical protein